MKNKLFKFSILILFSLSININYLKADNYTYVKKLDFTKYTGDLLGDFTGIKKGKKRVRGVNFGRKNFGSSKTSSDFYGTYTKKNTYYKGYFKHRYKNGKGPLYHYIEYKNNERYEQVATDSITEKEFEKVKKLIHYDIPLPFDFNKNYVDNNSMVSIIENTKVASNKSYNKICVSKSFNASYKLISQNKKCSNDEKEVLRSSDEYSEALNFIKISEEVDKKADKKGVLIDASNNKPIYVAANSASQRKFKIKPHQHRDVKLASASKYITKKKSKNTLALDEINKLYSDGLLSKSQCVRAKQKVLKLSSNLKNLCDNIIVRVIHKDDKAKTKNYIVKKVKPKINKKKVEKKISKKEPKVTQPKVTQPKVFQPKITELDKIAPIIITKLKIVSNTPNFVIEGTIKDNKNYKQGPFLEIEDTNVKFNKRTGKFSTKLYSPFSTQITLAATDLMGNRSEIVVDVTIKEETLVAKRMEKLNPSKIRKNRDTNKIALIIGIEKYDNVVASSYSNLDAKYFTQYIKNVAHPSNIITLLDDKATRSGSLAALAKELRGRIIADQSEVIIFFSGHGLAENEKDLYLLTNDSDQDLLEFTAIKRDQIIKLISSYKPKSVVMFLDTCYSGTSRKGEQLVASARPIRIKVNDDLNLPNNFSIFSASQASELSSGMDEEKQGIFSYYVMKGLEGNADENKDREITNGELHNYLTKNVPKKALQLHSRNQNPTFTGSADQVFLKY